MLSKKTHQRLFKTLFSLLLITNIFIWKIAQADDFEPLEESGSQTIQGDLSVEWDINFNQNEALEMALENANSAPTAPVKGQAYFNTIINKAYIWDGTEWLDMVDTGSWSVSVGTGATSTDSDYFTIDNDNNANTQILSFGSSFGKTLSFDTVNDWFNLSDRINIGWDGSLSWVKFTTRASASDSEQNQIEIRNNANITVFGVDEDGDLSLNGSVNGVNIVNLNSTVTTLNSDLSTLESNVTTNSNNLTTHTNNTSNPHQVSLEHARLQNNHLDGNLTSSGNISLTGTVDGVDVSDLNTNFTNHNSNTSNPHQTTLEQARSQDNQISGNIDFDQNQADNLVIDNLTTAPTSPVVGQIYYNTNTKISYYWNGSAWKRIGSAYFYETSDDTTSTTTSTTYQQKLRLSVTSVPAGKYRVGWYYEWQHRSTSNDYRGRIQLNDTTTIMEQREENQDSGSDQFHVASGFSYVDLTTGSHNFDLDYASSSNGVSTSIRRARLEFWRVSE